MIQAVKIVGTGLATTSLIDAGVGIGIRTKKIQQSIFIINPNGKTCRIFSSSTRCLADNGTSRNDEPNTPYSMDTPYSMPSPQAPLSPDSQVGSMASHESDTPSQKNLNQEIREESIQGKKDFNEIA